MRKAICMTGDDTRGEAGRIRIRAVMRIITRRGPVDIPHLFCPVEEGSNPGGDREPPNVPKPPIMRERERVGRNGRETERRERESGTQWERNGEKERERERERVGKRERERVGERPTEQETGANRRKGRAVGSS